MPVDNVVHFIGFRVPQYNLTPPPAPVDPTVYVAGVFEDNVFE